MCNCTKKIDRQRRNLILTNAFQTHVDQIFSLNFIVTNIDRPPKELRIVMQFLKLINISKFKIWLIPDPIISFFIWSGISISV